MWPPPDHGSAAWLSSRHDSLSTKHVPLLARVSDGALCLNERPAPIFVAAVWHWNLSYISFWNFGWNSFSSPYVMYTLYLCNYKKFLPEFPTAPKKKVSIHQ